MAKVLTGKGLKVLRLSQINAAQGPVSGAERLEEMAGVSRTLFFGLTGQVPPHRDLENLNVCCPKGGLRPERNKPSETLNLTPPEEVSISKTIQYWSIPLPQKGRRDPSLKVYKWWPTNHLA